MMQIAETLVRFVKDEFFQGREASLSLDANLLDGGVIDSLGILQVIEFISDAFGVSVDPDEVTPENFATVESIVQFVTGKKALNPSA